MRIQCPACDASYDLPEAAVKPGRPVRCARCATEWIPVPALDLASPAPEPLQTIPPPPEPLPEPPLPEPPRSAPQERLLPAGRAPADRTLLAGWVLSLAVLLILGWAAVTWRAEVMRAWPPSERAYAALGLAPAAR